LRDNLRAGNINALETRLEEFNRAQDQLLVSTARLGTVQKRLDQTESKLEDISVQMQQVVSDNIDADFAEVMVNLNSQTNAYQAALNASARVIQPSLLDYIR
jgi:flagellar hook-associated protein 3 FlgL